MKGLKLYFHFNTPLNATYIKDNRAHVKGPCQFCAYEHICVHFMCKWTVWRGIITGMCDDQYTSSQHITHLTPAAVSTLETWKNWLCGQGTSEKGLQGKYDLLLKYFAYAINNMANMDTCIWQMWIPVKAFSFCESWFLLLHHLHCYKIYWHVSLFLINQTKCCTFHWWKCGWKFNVLTIVRANIMEKKTAQQW